MKTPVTRVFLGAVLLIGCSDVTAPAAGMFQAQLSGARVATMSGPSNAGTSFTADFPDTRFAIRMFATQGDTVRVITFLCPGEAPPAPGTYPVTQAASDCPGRYSRVVSTLAGGTVVLEQAAASFGSLTISPSGEGQTVGTFSITGLLVVGTDSVGTLDASGTFSATVGP